MISVNEISNDLKDKLKKGSIATATATITGTAGTLAGAKKLGQMGKADLSNSLVNDIVGQFLPLGRIKGGVGMIRGLLKRKVGTSVDSVIDNSDPVKFIKNRTSSDYNPGNIARGINVAYQKLTDQY